MKISHYTKHPTCIPHVHVCQAIKIMSMNRTYSQYRVNFKTSSRKYSATGNTTLGMVNIGALPGGGGTSN